MCQELVFMDRMEVDSTYYSDSNSGEKLASPTVTHIDQDSILHKMPLVVFGQICVSLEPLWLLNLSQTCRYMQQQLSFEQSNKTWYDVLPSSVWKEAERYQDETELGTLLASHGSPKHLEPEMVVDFIHQDSTSASSPHTMSSPSSSYGPWSLATPPPTPTRARSINAMMTESPYPDYDSSPIRSNYGDPSAGYSSAGLSERRRIQALGGPYQPMFNYRREIVGYLKTSKRCYICLNLKGPAGESVNTWRWGILFCTECLKKHTVTLGVLRKLGLVSSDFSVLGDVNLLPYQTGSSLIFFRPEVNNLVCTATGLYLETQELNHKARQQLTEKERVGRSGLEGHRRIVRCLVVAAAELLWEGYDPSPMEIKDPESGKIIGWQQREGMGSSETYQAFRDRFAPTQKLKTFLFPDYLLDEFPTRLPYNPASGWMDDPTMLLRKKEQFDTLTERWVADRAFEMLEKLTDWRHTNYYHKGRGGYVTNWIRAAKEYHVERMEASLEECATVNLEHVPVESRQASELRRFHKLRVKCGLQDERSTTMHPLPQRPERGGLLSPYSFDQYVRLDQLAAAAEQERAAGIKYFNKIIRHTCVGCPETALLFYPMGFEALVEHMRSAHAKRFWTKDDFDTIG